MSSPKSSLPLESAVSGVHLFILEGICQPLLAAPLTTNLGSNSSQRNQGQDLDTAGKNNEERT